MAIILSNMFRLIAVGSSSRLGDSFRVRISVSFCADSGDQRRFQVRASERGDLLKLLAGDVVPGPRLGHHCVRFGPRGGPKQHPQLEGHGFHEQDLVLTIPDAVCCLLLQYRNSEEFPGVCVNESRKFILSH